MISARLVTKEFKKFERGLDAVDKKRIRTAEIATRVEGYRLSTLLKKEIRQGAPGGRKMAPLTYIGRRWTHAKGVISKSMRPDKPLARLAIAVRYYVKSRFPFLMEIGFVGPKVSKSWKRLAQKHQEGFTGTMKPERRAEFIRAGALMSKRVKTRKYMFLRKTTTSFRTPARPIIEPFWDSQEARAMQNIKANFARKWRGERI